LISIVCNKKKNKTTTKTTTPKTTKQNKKQSTAFGGLLWLRRIEGQVASS
jgi:hypothetical protein